MPNEKHHFTLGQINYECVHVLLRTCSISIISPGTQIRTIENHERNKKLNRVKSQRNWWSYCGLSTMFRWFCSLFARLSPSALDAISCTRYVVYKVFVYINRVWVCLVGNWCAAYYLSIGNIPNATAKRYNAIADVQYGHFVEKLSLGIVANLLSYWKRRLW